MMNNNYLVHHGILGMKWGVRRYQNADGTLTAAGRERYGSYISKGDSKYQKLEAKRTKFQERANRNYQKAEVSRHGLFKNEANARKYENDAKKYQYKADKIAYKGKRYYEKLTKKVKNLDPAYDGPIIERGKEYADMIITRSRAMSAARR